ncbi:hypothetical protein KCP74_14075 [Salmonella enterica subsp. enterica]|nr:hypothetical protein KCP74_14075 [Salmonella enterica subsp. enterica]
MTRAWGWRCCWIRKTAQLSGAAPPRRRECPKIDEAITLSWIATCATGNMRAARLHTATPVPGWQANAKSLRTEKVPNGSGALLSLARAGTIITASAGWRKDGNQTKRRRARSAA